MVQNEQPVAPQFDIDTALPSELTRIFPVRHLEMWLNATNEKSIPNISQIGVFIVLSPLCKKQKNGGASL
jgi:hypothetical protein